jgi:nicotinate-nucleotide pyrophosphorylase (carboxylating)
MMTGQDIRDLIFRRAWGNIYVAHISAQEEGILSGTDWLKKACQKLGISLRACRKNGSKVRPTEIIAVLEGQAKQMAAAEEELIGWISKASGIATAARRARRTAGKNLKVVCGAWKKMPLPIKDLVRQAITDGGIQFRIAEKPFLYLDKNYVRILGGVKRTLAEAKALEGFVLVIQLKEEGRRLLHEAALATKGGADIIMIDTGRREDIEKVDRSLRQQRLRNRVKIAFGGNIRIEDLKELRQMPVEIVDIGQSIVDAPLIDMRMDIIGKV